MRWIHLVALTFVRFVDALFHSICTPSTFLKRLPYLGVCILIGFSLALGTANFAKSSERVVAATPSTAYLMANNNFSKENTTSQRKTAMSYGDPHILTFDGFKYSFQTVGEFILAKSTDGDFEVQVRQSPGPGLSDVAINTAVAMKVNNTRVAFYTQNFPDSDTSTPLRVNGKPTSIQDQPISLPDGGSISRQDQNNYLVEWPTGHQVIVRMGLLFKGTPYLNVTSNVIYSKPGQFTGLFGYSNDESADDLRTQSGKVIPSRSNSTYGKIKDTVGNFVPVPGILNQAESLVFEQIYKDFGNSWRISQAESLFDYQSGQTTATFTDRSFPTQYRTLEMLAPAQVKTAKAACQDAGVEAELIDGCVFDVGFTGDRSFAQSAANILNGIEQIVPGGLPKPNLPIRIPGLRF